ncbi:MAG: DUF72 domain-containing protein, partial [Promethearchaeota archaeon]
INWNKRVPKNFRFIVKVWQKITHNLEDPDLDLYIIEFFSRLKWLEPKITRFLLQFPPWFKYSELNLQKLILLLKNVPVEYKYIIELRDNSWFNSEIYSQFIDGENRILGTTYMPGVIPYYMQDQNYYYIRLIGDRELSVFNQIQRNQKDAVNNLFKNIQDLIRDKNVYEIFIIVNNHFQGNAPESVNMLKKKFGITYHSFSDQKKLTDFFKKSS